ncbi:hypothetical protein CAN33_0039540 [Aspergillus niger]|nr:hypothetical protein ANI_1_1286164 [Aspergillus niger CBS 513.88]TPR01485.1 hypothetical protein CAN33_0039540 [Aspergillus niger]|eukprot:XP_001398821.2 hypothetical protein ANI_1_1286164 [Aspergillus niger CBS 513.88]
MGICVKSYSTSAYRIFGGNFISSQEGNESSTKRTQLQQPMVDWSTVRTWLGKCDKEHDGKLGFPCDNGPLETPPLEFRVIDTERGCVVGAPPGCRYATLSYVWGSTTDTYALATTNTIQALEEEGYLFKIPLPATIRDSIRACIELKIRYLWIDRLCIVQDDNITVKDSQINAMGNIYSHSYLTLVDLEGRSMDHGLPGVTQERTLEYQTHGMKLGVLEHGIFTLITYAKWGTRGWTFQEALLSTRVLLLADTGVLFECSRASQEVTSSGVSRPLDLMFNLAQDYRSLVSDFTSRTLTFDADVLKAFSGIMHWKYGSEHYFGVPYCEFVKGMLWNLDTIHKHKVLVARSAETGDIFPTWSWSSMMGPARLDSKTDIHTLLGVWGIPSFEAKELVHIIRPHNSELSWDEAEDGGMVRGLGIVLAWKEGCFPEPSPLMLNVNTTWEDYKTVIRSRWASVDKLNEEALGVANIRGKEDFERIFPSSYVEHADQPGALLAHTQSLRARMVQRGDTKIKPHKWPPHIHASLHSLGDEKVDVWIQSNPAHWQFLGHDYSKDHDTKLDVLALSMNHEYSKYEFLGRGEQGQWYDSEGTGLFERDYDIFVVNVLLVETRNGLSRRVAIGQVELHDWISASPEFRNFTLV